MGNQLFGGGAVAKSNSTINTWRLMQSTQGAVIPIVYGSQRIAPNWLWAGDYGSKSTGTGKSAQMFGKGGTAGPQYRIGAALALCSGAGLGVFTGTNISVGRAWESGTANALITTFGVAAQWIPFGGQDGQAPWGNLVVNHPDSAFGFSGVAYVATGAWNLGNSPQPPQINFEVYGLGMQRGLNVFAFGAPNGDADLGAVFIDLWVNTEIGLGADSNLIGNGGIQFNGAWVAGFPFFNTPLSEWEVFIGAAGMWCSPLLDRQQPASRWFQDLLDITQCELILTCEALYVRPYCTVPLSGTTANLLFQRYNYTPDLTPIGPPVTDDDYIVGPGEPPVTVERTFPQDRYNEVKIEYVDRNSNYNASILTTKLQSQIDLFTYRPAQVQKLHHIARQDVAMKAATMMLYKLTQDVNRYKFKLTQRWVWVDPMDIIAINDASLGLVNYPVRVVKIDEDAEFNLDFICSDVWTCAPDNFASQPSLSRSGQNSGGGPQSNVNTPVIFEPLPVITNGTLQIWMMVSNPDTNYGGCGVWISYDGGSSYARIGACTGSNPQGLLTAALPAHSGHDTTNTLSVNISEAGPNVSLDSISAASAALFNNLCYVDGELLSFTTAALTGSGIYNLTGLYRDAYNTAGIAHGAGSMFAYLNVVGQGAPGLFVYVTPPAQSTASLVGTALKFKFTPFNLEGAQEVDPSTVTAYSYTVTGAGLPSTPMTFNFSGTPSANQAVSNANATGHGLSLPAHLPGSVAVASVAATASTTFNIEVNGVVKGTLNFAIAATTGIFTFASNVAVNIGDVVSVVAPAIPDATLANVAITLSLVIL